MILTVGNINTNTAYEMSSYLEAADPGRNLMENSVAKF